MRTIRVTFFKRLPGIFTLVLALWGPVGASPGELAPPQQVIEQISSQLHQVLNEDPGRLDRDPDYVYRLANDILIPHVDFSRVSSLVLGKHWRRATPEQRERFSREFQRLLVRTYSTAFHQFGDWKIRYLPVRLSEDGKRALVPIEVTMPGSEPVKVLYHMHLKQGEWLAYDVKVEGVSLITNYRSTFSREIRRVGMDGLIRKLSGMNG